jgi:hypothetical protein
MIISVLGSNGSSDMSFQQWIGVRSIEAIGAVPLVLERRWLLTLFSFSFMILTLVNC